MALLVLSALTAGSAAASAQSPGAEAARAEASSPSASPSATVSSGDRVRGAKRARSRRSLIAPPRICSDENNLAKRSRALKAMACMTNYARSRSGLKRYRFTARLSRSANLKAADMLRCGAFSHTACNRPFDWWIEKKYVRGQCYWAGENIAWGSRTVGGVRDIFRAWMKSPGHRRAILSRQYTDLGIGFRGGSFQGRASARVWVQHFGRLC